MSSAAGSASASVSVPGPLSSVRTGLGEAGAGTSRLPGVLAGEAGAETSGVPGLTGEAGADTLSGVRGGVFGDVGEYCIRKKQGVAFENCGGINEPDINQN